jgi:phytoene dehydrogenase-like protein
VTAPRDPVVIVGGGIAGLLCARTLSHAGIAVALYERESEVGGRVRTTVRDGFVLDHGFQVLFSAYPTLAAALDLPALDLREFSPAAHIALGGGNRALIGDALADLSLLWPTLVAPQLSLLDKVRMLRLRYFATSLSFDDCFAARFDALTTRAFLRQRGFSDRAIRNFFAPFYGGILLDRSLESSASVLLYTFKMLAEGRTVVPSRGMGAIPAQLAAMLPPGTVRTNAGVARVLCDADGITGVQLENGDSVSATNVVLACDPPAIASLALTAQARVPVPDGSLGCTTVYLRSRTPLLPGTALWLNASDTATVSHAITISNVAASYAPAGSALTAATILGAAAALPDAELVPRVRTDLAAMGGTAECATAELLATWRVPYSQYAQPPGSTGRRVSAETAVHGLFVASEMGHTSSLEGAARGGIAAAEAVMRGAVRR